MTSSHPSAPKLQVNGLSAVNENASPSTTTPTDRTAMKLNMLRKIRPPALRYAWTFYHEKNLPASTSTSSDPTTTTTPSSSLNSYEDRLTTMLENITTIKTFWECVNGFPLQNVKMKDSVHFFKRGVRPVWEDARNVEGGAWTFRVAKAVSRDFWIEVLLMAVGEQFSEVLGKGDDICGISLSRRFTSDLIQVWNRRGQASVDGIRAVVFEQLSPGLKGAVKEGQFYYKLHSEHQGFDEVVAKAKRERGDVGNGEEEEEVGMVEEVGEEEEEGEIGMVGEMDLGEKAG
ncbi:MAG: hypothetical protein LQ344_006785 [Seirophora lacunosa]|nr:MAG: hypothetical protein LQ344_006785 [Seirophora lacunosa]